MSLTALTWAALAVGLVVLSVRRPVYAVALYFLTFFAAPEFWWWGDELPDVRYALVAGLVLLGAILIYLPQSTSDAGHRFGIVHWAAIGIVLNATFVQFVLASAPAISFDGYVELLKFVLLTVLLWRAIEDKRDLRIVLMSIALGAAYIGYEVTVNDRGYFSGGRLEGVGAPGAISSNSLASVMLVALPLIGVLFVSGKWRHKIMAALTAPLALNVLLLCNSRGAFIGLIGAGVAFAVIARGATRKRAIQVLALGGVALFLLLGDPDITDRFMTTFAGSEERDRSADSRLEFWQAGLLMVSDYPLGDGADSFKYVRGASYIAQVRQDDARDRSLHNGYLTEATDWGIQGLFLKLLFVGGALLAAYRTTTACRLKGLVEDSLMGICLIVAGAAWLIHSMFGSFLGNEWGFWIVAFLLRYAELYQPTAVTVAESPVQTRLSNAETIRCLSSSAT